MGSSKPKKLIRGQPNMAGRVWAMAAIDFVSSDGVPYFTFQLHIENHVGPPENEWPVLYFDLRKQGADAVAAIVAAAYVAQTVLDVFLENPNDKSMRVKAIQASKPPSPC
jgi:hypothetical protein